MIIVIAYLDYHRKQQTDERFDREILIFTIDQLFCQFNHRFKRLLIRNLK